MTNEIFYSKFNSIVGPIFIYASNNSIVALDFKMLDIYKHASYNPNLPILKTAQIELEEYLSKKRKNFTIHLDPKGTTFQKKAWSALLKIPYGETKSYKEQAKMLNNPNACRAVGSANGKNPIPIIIPCHRIISYSGKIGGYSGDITLKQKLLEIEGNFFNI